MWCPIYGTEKHPHNGAEVNSPTRIVSFAFWWRSWSGVNSCCVTCVCLSCYFHLDLWRTGYSHFRKLSAREMETYEARGGATAQLFPHNLRHGWIFQV